MPRVLTDEDFDGRVIRAIRATNPEIDLVRAVDVGLMEAPDPQVLQWAAENDRVILTFDKETMVGFALARVYANLPMPGLIVVIKPCGISEAANDIAICLLATHPDEVRGQVLYVPIARQATI